MSGAVAEANVFVAQLVAPGMGRRLLDRRAVAAADFDVVVLVRTHHLDGLAALRADAAYQGLRSIVRAAARRDYEIAARNVRQIAEVDHSRRAVFLFNFFYADDPDILVPVWQHTAKWFVDKTHLPDSTVLAPLDGERTDHGIINHASWPHYRTFLPHLALRRSFRRFVLSVFELNGVAAQPILYRRVSG